MSQSGKYYVQLTALSLGVALMAVKFIAWWWTNSNAIFTDALESIINVVAGSFALYSLWLAARPPDDNHPYGHGKIEFISAGVEGALIALAGLAILGKASYNLVFPQSLHDLGVGMLLTVFAGLVNGGMGMWLERQGQRERSMTLEASGKHLQSDAWSSGGLLVGLALVWFTGIDSLDNVVALFFGAYIIYTGFGLLRRSVAGIMDEADDELIGRVVAQLNTQRSANWIDIHNLRFIQYGAELHLDCHLTLPWYFDTRQGHAEVKAFERLVNESCGQPVELFIHVDPCNPAVACRICQKNDCRWREHEPELRLEWTSLNVKENRNHQAPVIEEGTTNDGDS